MNKWFSENKYKNVSKIGQNGIWKWSEILDQKLLEKYGPKIGPESFGQFHLFIIQKWVKMIDYGCHTGSKLVRRGSGPRRALFNGPKRPDGRNLPMIMENFISDRVDQHFCLWYV